MQPVIEEENSITGGHSIGHGGGAVISNLPTETMFLEHGNDERN